MDACSHSPRVRAISYSREFSMATAAVAANAVISCSSSAVNPPRVLSAKYRLPNTSSRIRIGTPRKLSMGGCSAGKPDERGSSAMRESRIGRGSSISAPSSPLPCGRCPIRSTVPADMPTCTNSASPPAGEITPSAA
jgi:hypothetical protein